MTHEERARKFWAEAIPKGTPVEKLTREFQAVADEARKKATMDCWELTGTPHCECDRAIAGLRRAERKGEVDDDV